MTDTRERRGLTAAEVERARQKHGKNLLTKQKRKGFWRHFLENLGDPIIKVLLLALALNLILLFRSHDWFETVGIAVSVFLATFISTLSEHGSEAAFQKLCDSCEAPLCRVRREGRVMEIPAEDVVVGDLVLLAAGERIPADGRLLAGRLAVDQASLTGESREAEKFPSSLSGNTADPAAPACLFGGCTVLSGEGEMTVTAVGDATLLGGISEELQREARESPLRARLARLAHQISRIGYAAAAVCVLAFLFYRLVMEGGFSPAVTLSRLRDLPYMVELLLHALMLGLTVVVVAVPEGLPMMIAVVLSSNIRRMVQDQVLVRKPAGLEAAGTMNILFTDKTGTLTKGKLTLRSIITADGSYAAVTALPLPLREQLRLAAHAASGAMRCEAEGEPPRLHGGNATDRALLRAFFDAKSPLLPALRREPFDSTKKYASATLSDGRTFLMGAPERLMPHVFSARNGAGCDIPLQKAVFLTILQRRMAAGERVILLCESAKPPQGTPHGPLTLLAAFSFSDPLRSEAASAVRRLQRAGIRVVMMTGDSKETAARIATDCGILQGDGLCLSADELSTLSDAELSCLLPRLAVVARALPSDKSRLIRLSAEAGLVVGMTGDGINDAPALKSADVGFAMGSGTQVAKEAGDVVILDDNLASIANAVLYGRTIFKSIRKFITLQLVMNFCAVGISIVGPFIGFDSPVTVVQMLWINLIMDTLGGLAFAGEAPLPLYMQERPRGREEPILTKALAARIATLTAFTVALSVFFLKSHTVRALYRDLPDDICLLTAFFALFIFAGVFNCFNARTDRVRMLLGLARNPAFIFIMLTVATVQIAFVYLGGTVLRTIPLTPRELLVTLALSLTVLPVGWLQLVWRRLCGKEGLY